MASFTDNLDGTPGSALASRSGWSRPVGSDTWPLRAGGSGYLPTNGTTLASSTWHVPNSQPSGNDQFSEAILGQSSGGMAFPLGVRCDVSNGSGQGYFARVSNSVIQLYRRSAAGAFTSLGTYSPPTPSDLASNPVRLEVVGSEISVYFMGSRVIGPVTDAAIASGSVASLSRGGSTGAALFDEAAWGDVGAAAITGTMAAQESGSDSFAGSGLVLIQGGLAAAEQGDDAFSGLGSTGSAVTIRPTVGRPDHARHLKRPVQIIEARPRQFAGGRR